MREDGDGPIGGQGQDVVEGGPRAFHGHDVILAPRRLVVPVIEATRHQCARPALLDLHAVQPVPVRPSSSRAGGDRSRRRRARGPLLPPRAPASHAHGRAARPHDHLGRLVTRLLELARQRPAHASRLLTASFRQRRIEMTLRPLFGIPDRLAVPEEIDRMMRRHSAFDLAVPAPGPVVNQTKGFQHSHLRYVPGPDDSMKVSSCLL